MLHLSLSAPSGQLQEVQEVRALTGCCALIYLYIDCIYIIDNPTLIIYIINALLLLQSQAAQLVRVAEL